MDYLGGVMTPDQRVQLEKQQKKEKRKQAKTKRTWENVARVDMELNAHEKELHGLARRFFILI